MKITILTGAGISRESGLQTFRDIDGLWNGYSIDEVCTPEALARNPEKVLDFYNMRRQEVNKSEPNAAHEALAELETHHLVRIVTQNIDNLHERAGSKKVLHIHGEIMKARSIRDFDQLVNVSGDIEIGDLAPDGEQLRPHVCFFGEAPYDWEIACDWAMDCDLFAVIGTSLNVYPAAGLVDMTSARDVVLIDPDPPRVQLRRARLETIAEPATVGVPQWVSGLIP
jgi:NAD-dependent deacetylase